MLQIRAAGTRGRRQGADTASGGGEGGGGGKRRGRRERKGGGEGRTGGKTGDGRVKRRTVTAADGRLTPQPHTAAPHHSHPP
eukprot:364301-Chlamydomonas_euryale.AAC.6